MAPLSIHRPRAVPSAPNARTIAATHRTAVPNATKEKGAGAAAFNSCIAAIPSPVGSRPTAGITIVDQEKNTPALTAAPAAAAIVSQSGPLTPLSVRERACVE